MLHAPGRHSGTQLPVAAGPSCPSSIQSMGRVSMFPLLWGRSL